MNNNLYLIYASININKNILINLLNVNINNKFNNKLLDLLKEYILLEQEINKYIYKIKPITDKTYLKKLYLEYKEKIDNLN
jgi:hypothetical protein